MYALIKWSFKFITMDDDDFSFYSIAMWIPLIQTIVLIVFFFMTLGSRNAYIKEHTHYKRKFREALFGVEKVNGRYQKKKNA